MRRPKSLSELWLQMTKRAFNTGGIHKLLDAEVLAGKIEQGEAQITLNVLSKISSK